MKKHLFAIICFCVVYCLNAAGQRLEVSAPSTVYPNQGFTVKYSISCDQKPSNFVIPDVQGAKKTSGPMQGTSSYYSNMNGQVTSSTSYTYSFMFHAGDRGVIKISPAQVSVGGKIYRSNALTISISDNPPQQQRQPNSRYPQRPNYPQYQQGPNNPQYNNPQQKNNAPTEVNIDNSALFIRAIPNKTNVVRGEEVIISYKLYTLVPVSEYSIQSIPSTYGFWVEELDQQEKPELRKEEYNGQVYQVATLRKVIVYPQRTGVLNIPGMDVSIVAHIARQTAMRFSTGDPFFSRSVTSYQRVDKKLKTNAINITVNELPNPLPQDYIGAVGKFTLESGEPTKKIKAFDAFYLTYTLKGKGNITLINGLPLNLPDEFQTSDAEITDKLSRSGAGLTGSRTFRYLVIPSVEGDYKIPDLTITYYDIESRQYQTITCQGFDIHVDKGDASSGYAKQLDKRAKYRAMDIKSMQALNIKGKAVHIFDRGWIYVIVFVMIALCVLSIFFYARHLDFMSDVVNMKTKRANRMAQRRLRKARKLLKQEQYEAFEDEIAVALWKYLLDRFKINMADFSLEQCKSKLLQEGVNQDIVNNLGSIFERCQYVRFSPDKTSKDDQKIYNDTIEVITALEQEMKKVAKMPKNLGVFLLLTLCSMGLYAQNLQDANKQFNLKNYDAALQKYELLAKKEPSKTVYCAMGECYFRKSDYANAMLYYEKALKLAPQDKDIQLNINIVRSRLMGDCYIMPDFLPTRLVKTLAGQVSIIGWSIMFLVLFLAACVGLFLYRFSQDRKPFFFYCSLICLILSLSSMGLGICRQNIQNDNSHAIVMRANIGLKSTRSASSKEITQLYKGQKIKILEQDNSKWLKVQTEDHREGYIENKDYKII